MREKNPNIQMHLLSKSEDKQYAFGAEAQTAAFVLQRMSQKVLGDVNF